MTCNVNWKTIFIHNALYNFINQTHKIHYSLNKINASKIHSSRVILIYNHQRTNLEKITNIFKIYFIHLKLNKD